MIREVLPGVFTTAPADINVAPPYSQFPEADGKPMGETDFHIRAILHLFQLLDHFFRQEEKVYVGADLLFCYDVENPAQFIVLDVFVVKGVSKHQRRTYRLLEEQVVPCVVFEISSKSTWLSDWGMKRTIYESLGVREYFVFDPLDEYLEPRLQGYRRHDGTYRPIALQKDGAILSSELNLLLKPQATLLRLADPKTKRYLLTYSEMEQRALKAVKRAQTEAKRARLQTKLAQIQVERARIETERAQAEAERAQAEAERAARAEQENERLRAELERLRRENLNN